MSISAKTRFRIGLVAVVVTFTAFLLVHAEVPKGWYLAGSKPAEYESSVDDVNTFSGQPSLAFDNMQDRPIKGVTGWKEYEVVTANS